MTWCWGLGFENPSHIKVTWSHPPYAAYIGCSYLGSRWHHRTGEGPPCTFITKIGLVNGKLQPVSVSDQHSSECSSPQKLSLSSSTSKRSHRDLAPEDLKPKIKKHRQIGSSQSLNTSSPVASTSRVPIPHHPAPPPPSTLSKHSSTATNHHSNAPSLPHQLAPNSPLAKILLPITQKAHLLIPAKRDPWSLQLSSIPQAISPSSTLKNRAEAFIGAGITSVQAFELMISVGVQTSLMLNL